MVFTNASGNFAISGLTGSTITVTASLLGRWFELINFGGAGVTETLEITPPGPANFFFNLDNGNELVRAQVNAFVESNRVRTFALDANPNYPTLDNTAFPVTVNRADGFCPGNAWYSGQGGGNMNFCRAGGAYNNTAFSSVVYHEYGHHLVNAGGSGQGAYGEGMADAIGVLMQDIPELGLGFRSATCDSGLRTADNDLQYPCFGEIHYCGQLLSGCVWDIRNELVATNPTDYTAILAGLTINSIHVAQRTSIDPEHVHRLPDARRRQRDDLRRDAALRSDHRRLRGARHGRAGARAVVGDLPGWTSRLRGAHGRDRTRDISGVTAEPLPGTGVLHYDAGTGPIALPMQQVAPNVYDAVFPPVACRTRLSYWFSAQTTTGETATWPERAPEERFEAVSAVGEIVIQADDFETDAGWTVEDENLEAGSWERGTPRGTGRRGAPVGDFDGSGQCWLTNDSGTVDVDGGPTRLISPPFDLMDADDPEIAYARWFTNNDDDEDRLDVEVSNDGETWISVESVPNEPTGWASRSFRVRDYVELSNEIRLRFSAADDPDNSVTEAAIDALRIFEIDCGVPPCTGDVDASGRRRLQRSGDSARKLGGLPGGSDRMPIGSRRQRPRGFRRPGRPAGELGRLRVGRATRPPSASTRRPRSVARGRHPTDAACSGTARGDAYRASSRAPARRRA